MSTCDNKNTAALHSSTNQRNIINKTKFLMKTCRLSVTRKHKTKNAKR